MKKNTSFYLDKELLLFFKYLKNNKKCKSVSAFLNENIYKLKEYKDFLNYKRKIEKNEPSLFKFKNGKIIYTKIA